MTKVWLGIATLVLVAAAAAGLFMWRAALADEVQRAEAGAEGSLYDLATHSLAGEPVELARYRGQVALVVNVASKCGLTPQYAGLEKLYQELVERGFVVLGFPSNDFLNQEPGTPAEIRAFCDANYQITFPLFAKVHVKGDEKSAVYDFLTRTLDEPSWNFTKYLVDAGGVVRYRFAPQTAPDDPELRRLIEAELARAAEREPTAE
jgi:glutathione peroxidase